MADEDNGAPPSAIDGEQLRALLIQQTVQQAQQLLAIVGVDVSSATTQLEAAAAAHIAAQEQLLPAVLQSFRGADATAAPGFAVELSRDGAAVLVIGGESPSQRVVVGGPKQLSSRDAPHNIGGTLSALAFLLNPALRVAATLLNVRVNFQQLKTQPPQPRIVKARH